MTQDSIPSAERQSVAPVMSETHAPPHPLSHAPITAVARAQRLASGIVLAGLAARVAADPVILDLAPNPELDPARPSDAPLASPACVPADAPIISTDVLTTPPPAFESRGAPIRLRPRRARGAPPHTPLFCNPIARGADPWVAQHSGHYYYCEPVRDNSICVWTSDRLTHRGQRQIVWRAPRRGWNSHLIWAPELHRLDGRWYIYYTASAGPKDNAGHRTGVLESVADDPCGPYRDRGMVYTGDDPSRRTGNCWAIDATILDLHTGRYLLWSGWPDERDAQYLYISALENPWTTRGPRVRLCDNDTYTWERIGDDPRERGLHEGPQVLLRDGRVFVVYSCSGSWQTHYKLGLLELAGDGDPLKSANWLKHPTPVFQSTADVYGVGHASFVKSPDGREDWVVYHAKVSRSDGWERVVCVQPFTWRADGLPDFGRPAPWETPLPAPSGDPGLSSPRPRARRSPLRPAPRSA